MNIAPLNSCCGVHELTDLVTAVPTIGLTAEQRKLSGMPRVVISVLLDFAVRRVRNLPFVLFTDVIGHVGTYLAEAIKDRKLGSIYESERGVNPNTANDIRIWIWTPNYIALDALVNTQRQDLQAEVDANLALNKALKGL